MVAPALRKQSTDIRKELEGQSETNQQPNNSVFKTLSVLLHTKSKSSEITGHSIRSRDNKMYCRAQDLILSEVDY